MTESTAKKTALVTGCSAGGIGYALVISLQKRGFTVFATARSIKKMSDLAILPNVHLLEVDVVSPTAVKNAAEQISAKSDGRLDVLINNAGVLQVMPALDMDVNEARELFEVNYWAPIRLIQAFAPMLITAKGCIVNIGSSAGIFTIPFQRTTQAQYNASKAALNNFSETLRLELAPLGVRVITHIAGGTESKIFMNGGTPTSLPEHSHYKSIEKYVTQDLKTSKLSAEKFADSLTEDIINGHSGKVYKGTGSVLTRWIVPFLPQWAFDKLILDNVGRGLSQL